MDINKMDHIMQIYILIKNPLVEYIHYLYLNFQKGEILIYDL